MNTLASLNLLDRIPCSRHTERMYVWGGTITPEKGEWVSEAAGGDLTKVHINTWDSYDNGSDGRHHMCDIKTYIIYLGSKAYHGRMSLDKYGIHIRFTVSKDGILMEFEECDILYDKNRVLNFAIPHEDLGHQVYPLGLSNEDLFEIALTHNIQLPQPLRRDILQWIGKEITQEIKLHDGYLG